MGWTNSTITNNGITMLNKSLVGHVLTITHVVGGAGILDPQELESAIDVKEEMQTFGLLGIENVDGGKKIKIQITNENVSEKYVLHQVAVFAKLDDEPDSSLLLIMQDDLGVEIPTRDETPDFIFEMYAVIGISNTANIKVNVDSDLSVSVHYLKESIQNHNNDPNSHPQLLQAIMEAYSSVLAQVGGIKKSLDFSIPTGEWETVENPQNNYLYFYDLKNEEITSKMIPEVVLTEDSIEIANQSGMCSTAVTYDGYLRIKCMEIPTADIVATCNLLVQSGAVDDVSTVLPIPIATATTVGGIKASDTIFIDEDGTAHVVNVNGTGNVATDEEVEAALGEVFGSSIPTDAEIATDEEIAEMLSEVFNADDSPVASDREVNQMLTDIFGE